MGIAIKLKRSVRQIDRMIVGYKKYDKEFFVHGNRGRKPSRAFTEEFKTEIELLYTKYGIPYLIKTDKRTVFEYKKKASSRVEEDTFTQYSYACKQLGIQIQTSSVPEFKPRVERLFQTLQQRLPQALRLAQITTIDEKYLKFNQNQ